MTIQERHYIKNKQEHNYIAREIANEIVREIANEKTGNTFINKQ